MGKFWTVCKYEYAQVVKKRSFLIGLLLTPVIMVTFMVLPALFAKAEVSDSEKLVILDHSGLQLTSPFIEAIQQYTLKEGTVPAYLVTGVLTSAPDDTVAYGHLLDSLREVINRKEAKYALVFGPQAHVIDSATLLITNEDNPRTVNRFERHISELLSAKRLTVSNVNLPVDSVLHLTRSVELPIQDTRGQAVSSEVKLFALLIMIMLIYIMIITYGATLLRSVVDEKSSRIMELLVSSVSPFELMMGKIIGLAGATMTSVLAWVVLGLAAYLGSGAFAIPVSPAVGAIISNPVIVVCFVLFLTSGYVLYSTIFALLGSIINSEKEAQNFYFPIIIAVMMPLFLSGYLIQQPNSTVSIALSLFPFFAPTMMMARVAILAPGLTEYSLFSGIILQAIVAFILVLLAIAGMIWVTGKIFRVGVLMYGKRPTLPELVKWIRY
ncbi:MAG: ABC transporter permease [Candidatus Zixiibacteriota bacterium]